MVVGGAVGGLSGLVSSAFTGQNPGLGFLTGALSGAALGYLGDSLGSGNSATADAGYPKYAAFGGDQITVNDAGAIQFEMEFKLDAARPSLKALAAAQGMQGPTIDPISMIAGGLAGAGASLAKAASVSLFRAVSAAELRSITNTGILKAGPNSLGAKWFAESARDASAWGKALYRFDKEAFYTIEVRVPRSVADRMMRVSRLDSIGPARVG